MFTSSIKSEIRNFQVVVVQRRQRNVQTKNVIHVQSCCFANLNLLLFCRCCWRRHRRCLSSVQMDARLLANNSQHCWMLHVASACTYLFIYQLFWTQACPEGMWTSGTQVPCEVPSLPNPTTRKGWPHHRGLRPLLFSNSDVGSFTSHKNKSVKVLWDGTYGFSSLSEKTTKSNHLKMSLKRQHFLLSYLKTLSVGPVGVWTRDLPLGRPALSQLS